MKKKTNLVRLALNLRAITFHPEDSQTPFVFDMEKFMGYHELRTLLIEILFDEYHHLYTKESLIKEDLIIGGIGLSATGIATIIAEKLGLDCFGIEELHMKAPSWIKDCEVICFSPLIHTGATTLRGINAIRSAGGICDSIFSIFNQEKTIILERLNGKVGVGTKAHEGQIKLKNPCKNVCALFTPQIIIQILGEIYLSQENYDLAKQVKEYATSLGEGLAQTQQATA